MMVWVGRVVCWNLRNADQSRAHGWGARAISAIPAACRCESSLSQIAQM